MSGRFLLDTNIIIALLAGESAIEEHLAAAEEVFLPIIAVGELCYGAKKSGKSQKNLERINQLIDRSVVLACDVETARQYGDVKNKLRLKGQPLPENDIWTGALALQYNLTLATRDAHFQEIESLLTTGWQAMRAQR